MWTNWDKGEVIFETNMTTSATVTHEAYLLMGEMWAWHKCRHEDQVLTDRKISDGRRSCCYQCKRCGRASPAVKDQETEFRFDEGLQGRHAAIKVDLADKLNARKYHLLKEISGGLSADYSEYRNSDEWKELRSRIFKRCEGVCEGCGIADANEVHHKTYDNITEEFLFELLGLCSDCHKRWHDNEKRRLA